MVYSHKIHYMKYGINDNCMLYRLYNLHGDQVCERAGCREVGGEMRWMKDKMEEGMPLGNEG